VRSAANPSKKMAHGTQRLDVRQMRLPTCLVRCIAWFGLAAVPIAMLVSPVEDARYMARRKACYCATKREYPGSAMISRLDELGIPIAQNIMMRQAYDPSRTCPLCDSVLTGYFCVTMSSGYSAWYRCDRCGKSLYPRDLPTK
jgi:hypothetical protein